MLKYRNPAARASASSFRSPLALATKIHYRLDSEAGQLLHAACCRLCAAIEFAIHFVEVWELLVTGGLL